MRFSKKYWIFIGVVVVLAGIFVGKSYLDYRLAQRTAAITHVINKNVSLTNLREMVTSDADYPKSAAQEVKSYRVVYSKKRNFGHTGYIDPAGGLHVFGYINGDKSLSFELSLVYDGDNAMNLGEKVGEIDGWRTSVKLDDYLTGNLND